MKERKRERERETVTRLLLYLQSKAIVEYIRELPLRSHKYFCANTRVIAAFYGYDYDPEIWLQDNASTMFSRVIRYNPSFLLYDKKEAQQNSAFPDAYRRKVIPFPFFSSNMFFCTVISLPRRMINLRGEHEEFYAFNCLPLRN